MRPHVRVRGRHRDRQQKQPVRRGGGQPRRDPVNRQERGRDADAPRDLRDALRAIPYKAMSGWRRSKASGRVERRRGVSGLEARDPGRRDTPGDEVLKERRSPRERGRMGTSLR